MGAKKTAVQSFSLSPFLPFSLSVLSGLLLAFSFPRFDLGFLAWFALVPLLAAIRLAPSRAKAAQCGLTAGLVFYCISIHWLTEVTSFGWLFMTLLETGFMVLFAITCFEVQNIRSAFLRAPAYALTWFFYEWLRSVVPVFAFGWNLLAYTQSSYLPILQSANTFGAEGLSFTVALINGLLFEIIKQISDLRLQSSDSGKSKKKPLFALLGMLAEVILIFTLMLLHGFHDLTQSGTPKGDLRISVIQGNIAQNVKWEAVARDRILEIYSKLTELASFDQPELIIWPEAAFPGYFNRDRDAAEIRDLIARLGIPAVIGAPHFFEPDNAYNSAYLLGADGQVQQRYDKQVLVPFGEYVPLKLVFGWLEKFAYSLGVSDFSAGKDKTVFEIVNGDVHFSVLICFEDIFPELARAFVDKGADFLSVITNDAWFGNSAGPYQHLQASVFRAVENGVPVVRAANTGISAFISPQGKVLDRVHDAKGEDLFVTGKSTASIPLSSRVTLYRRGGWMFPYAAAAAFVIMIIAMIMISKKAEGRR